MKKLCVIVIFSFFHFFHVQGQHRGDFRSKSGGAGSWNEFQTWEIFNGKAWASAASGQLPSSLSEVEIKSGDTIFVNDSLSVSGNLKVNGILRFYKVNDCKVKVYGNVFVGKTGIVTSQVSGSVYTHLLLIGGRIYSPSESQGFVAGIYAIGPKTSYAGYAGCYSKLTDAVAAISSLSLTGNLIFEFQPDYNPSVETYPISLNSNIGSSETASITFRPASSVNSVINFSTSGTVLNNTGADYIIFDGRNGGSGTNQYLQFENKDSYYSTISLSNDVLQNKFLYCILTGSTKVTETGILTLNSSKSGNNFNTIDHCDFNGNGSVNNCIFTKGLTSDLTITNCNFIDFRNGAGINLSNGCNNVIIDHNNFFQTKSYSGFDGVTSGIIVNGGANCRISNNNIGGSSSGLNGTWTVSESSPANYYFTGISATSLATTSKIYNNRIQSINWKTKLSDWTGIYVSGVVKVGTDGANYIGNNTGNDNIVLNYYSNGASKVRGIISEGAAIVENNIIGSFTTLLTGIGGTGINFTGIYSTGTGIINQNTIGSSTISNSINISPQSQTGFNQNLYGIYSSASSAITNNIIANLYNGSIVSSGVTTGILVLFSGYATLNVSSNTIHSISTSQPVTSLGSSASLSGINIQSNAKLNTPTVTITGNSIYDLINLSSSDICINGILFCSSNAIGNKVDKNLIHSFKSASNNAIQNGINIIDGSATFQNNVIRLGIDVNGNSIISTAQINGILKSTTSSCHFYFNTVYIGGLNVLSGSVKTYAMNFAAKSSNSDDLKNNIFINMRTNAIPNKLNYAALEPSFGTNSGSSDYNIYYVTPTDGILSLINGLDVFTLKDLQTANPGGELHSGFGDPLLSHPSDPIGSMDLIPTDLSPAESTGIEVAGIIDDITGALRSSNTPTDIGAYSGNIVRNDSTQDIFFPVIQFEKLGNASSLTNRQTKNFAAITDNVGRINVNPGTKPRLYYKLSKNADAFVGNTASDNGWKWVEASGVTSPFDFNIDYSKLQNGPVETGSVIQYFVVAQDKATIPYVTFNPWKGSSGTSVASEGMVSPIMPNSYTIVSSIPATINVGSGQTYSTLTGNDGAFAAINSGSVSSDIILTIKSDLVEPGLISLNQLNEEGPNAGSLTLTIQSDNLSHLISGTSISVLNPLISIDGVKRLTINGGVNKQLTFRNVNSNPLFTGPVIQFNNSADNDLLTNCIIESNSIYKFYGAIYIGSIGINSVTISQNDIRNSGGKLTGSPIVGIYSESSNNMLNISNNNIYNLKNADSYGMYLYGVASGSTITGNSIYMGNGITANGSFTGIYISSSNHYLISGNYIGGSAPRCGGSQPFGLTGNSIFTGIYTMNTSFPEATVQGNFIQNISMTNNLTPEFYGINNSSGPVIITGNMIGSDITSNSIKIAGSGESSGIIQNFTGVTNECRVEKNTIANIALTNSTGSPIFSALKLSGGNVRMNNIFNIESTGQTLTPIIYGINNTNGIDVNEFSNNVISLGGGAASASTLYGFYYNSSTGSTGMYFNSINIVGSASGGNSSFTCYREGNGVCLAKNNVFSNFRTGGTGNHYAIYAAFPSGLTSDYNDYYVSGTILGHLGIPGTMNDIPDLISWKAALKQDINSFSENPLFTTLTILIPADSSIVNGAGTAITGFTTDRTGAPRNAISPTIGAYELICNCPSFGGTIGVDQQIGNSLPDLIRNLSSATGYKGKLEYKWQFSESPFTSWKDIEASNASAFQPGMISKTTQYKRFARTTCMNGWLGSVGSNVVTLSLIKNKWNGILSNDWNDPGNWTLNKVPVANEDVIFDANPLHDCLLDHDRVVNDITNNQSAFCLDLNGKSLTIKGNLNFSNGANINSTLLNSTVVFSGEKCQTIPSDVFLNNEIYNLIIDNAVGVSPESDFSIKHMLTINPGKKLIIPTEKLLHVAGTINNIAGVSGLVIKAHPQGLYPSGSVIFHNDASKESFVPATVEMFTKAAKTDGLFKWQFFGIPLRSMPANPTFSGSFVREMHEDVSGTSGHWEQLQNETVLTSFKGYEITQETGKTICFEGILENADFGPKELTFTSDAFYKGQHLIGNPYLAAINIRNDENPFNSLCFGDGMDKTVYLYNTGSADDWSKNGLNGSGNNDAPGQYLAIPQKNAGSNLLPASIPSMQAFLVKVKTPGNLATVYIPYSSTGTVIKNNTLLRVPLQKKISTRIDVSSSQTGPGDRMWIFTDPTCTRGFDNGWDGYKMMGSETKPQLYAIEEDGNYQVNTIDDINGTFLGFKAGIDTFYTLTFNHENRDERYRHLYLIDLRKNKTIEITSDKSQYLFESNPGSTSERRFKIIATQNELDLTTNNLSTDAAPLTLKVYTSGKIVLVNNQSPLNGNLYLYDMTGRNIQKLPFKANQVTSIPIQMPIGSYLTKAVTQKEQVTTKLLFTEQ